MKRLLAAALAVAAAAVVVLVIVLATAGGASGQGPADGAATLVPADALVYVNVSTDPSRTAVKRALMLAERFPGYPLATAAVQTRLAAILSGGSSSASFAADVRPWLGKEGAFALLNTASTVAGSLIVLDVTDQPRARSFVKSSGAQSDGTYRGSELLRDPSGTVLAFVSHYLVLGQDASVRAAIDVAAGASPSLASDSAFRRASAGEPDDRVLDAYASAAGVRRVLAAQAGALGALGVLLNEPSLEGVAISVSPDRAGARVRVHSVLYPSLVRVSGAPRAPFMPTLQNVIPAGSLLLLDVTGLDQLAPRVLSAGATAGIAGRIGPLLARLGAALRAEGVNLSSITSIFHGESAVAIAPASSSAPPALVIVARPADAVQARQSLATLEVPLSQLFAAPSSGPGQTPVFTDRSVDGVTVHQLSLTPGLQLDYAVFHGLVVLATSIGGIEGVIGHTQSIGQESQFRASLSSRPARVSSLLFLNFSQLLSLGEQTGLTRSTRLGALAPDLDMIQAVGMDSTSGEADTTAELFFQIS